MYFLSWNTRIIRVYLDFFKFVIGLPFCLSLLQTREKKKPSKTRQLVNKDGKVLNVNEPKYVNSYTLIHLLRLPISILHFFLIVQDRFHFERWGGRVCSRHGRVQVSTVYHVLPKAIISCWPIPSSQWSFYPGQVSWYIISRCWCPDFVCESCYPGKGSYLLFFCFLL